MSRPKEPNFFSDDENYARGFDWYASFFEGAGDSLLLGESSTHYTKLPTYPRTVERMVRDIPRVKLIYVMRHPIDRLISHYFHEVTVGRINVGLEEAINNHPELVDYGRYSMQLAPYLEAYGPESVHPVFFDRLVARPDLELERIGQFLGVPQTLQWDHRLKPQNVGRERLRSSRIRDALVQSPLITGLRRTILPRSWSEALKHLWKVRNGPPPVPSELHNRLRDIFDPDLARVGSWLGITLDCDSFHEVSAARTHGWTGLEIPFPPSREKDCLGPLIPVPEPRRMLEPRPGSVWPLRLESGDRPRVCWGGAGVNWVGYAALSAVFAGLTAVLAKIGVSQVPSNVATLVRTVVVVVFATLIVAASGQLHHLKSITGRDWMASFSREWQRGSPGSFTSRHSSTDRSPASPRSTS